MLSPEHNTQTAKLALKVKGYTITFDRKETLKLTRFYYLEFQRKGKDYEVRVRNGITDCIHKYNDRGFFYCSQKRLDDIKLKSFTKLVFANGSTNRLSE